MSRDDPFDRDFVVEFHLLGLVDFDECAGLQQRLAEQARIEQDGRIVVLLCEHEECISVGRLGSRAHVRLAPDELEHRNVALRWIGRGGGCVPHAPGQLAVYPIVPLVWHGWSPGEYLRRLHRALAETLAEFQVPAQRVPGSFGVWGQTGLLAAVGVTVRGGVATHGAWLNVHPPMNLFHFVDTAARMRLEQPTMSCLLAERRQATKMPAARARLIAHLVAAFGAERHHLYTGHPWLSSRPVREPRAHR